MLNISYIGEAPLTTQWAKDVGRKTDAEQKVCQRGDPKDFLDTLMLAQVIRRPVHNQRQDSAGHLSSISAPGRPSKVETSPPAWTCRWLVSWGGSQPRYPGSSPLNTSPRYKYFEEITCLSALCGRRENALLPATASPHLRFPMPHRRF